MAPLRHAAGNRGDAVRRVDTAWRAARRDRGGRAPRDQRAGAGVTPELGLIEGFFGRPWRWTDRHDAVKYLAPHGFGFYLYAPKADAFLRRRWQEPHPETELAELTAFA